MPRKLTSAAVIRLMAEVDEGLKRVTSAHQRKIDALFARADDLRQLCPHAHLESTPRTGRFGIVLGCVRYCNDCGVMVDTADDCGWALDELLKHLTPAAIIKAVGPRARVINAAARQQLAKQPKKKSKAKRGK